MKISRLIAVTLFGAFFVPLEFARGQGEEKMLAARIDALIKVFAHPEAQADNIDETARAIQELTAIGKPVSKRFTGSTTNKQTTASVRHIRRNKRICNASV